MLNINNLYLKKHISICITIKPLNTSILYAIGPDDLLVLFWLMEVDEWSHHLVDQQPAIVCRIPRVTAFWPRDVHKRKFMQPLATGFQWSHCLSDAPSSFESALHGIDAVDVALVMWVSAS